MTEVSALFTMTTARLSTEYALFSMAFNHENGVLNGNYLSEYDGYNPKYKEVRFYDKKDF